MTDRRRSETHRTNEGTGEVMYHHCRLICKYTFTMGCTEESGGHHSNEEGDGKFHHFSVLEVMVIM